MLVFRAYIIHVNQISDTCYSTFLEQAAGISWIPCGMFRLFSCFVLFFFLTPDLWCDAAGWTLLVLQGKQGSGLGKSELGFRRNHKKGSGAASLTPEVSWAGPVDFSLSFEYVYMCCVHLHALCPWPWAQTYLVLYKFTDVPLLPGKASCTIRTDKLSVRGIQSNLYASECKCMCNQSE